MKRAKMPDTMPKMMANLHGDVCEKKIRGIRDARWASGKAAWRTGGHRQMQRGQRGCKAYVLLSLWAETLRGLAFATAAAPSVPFFAPARRLRGKWKRGERGGEKKCDAEPSRPGLKKREGRVGAQLTVHVPSTWQLLTLISCMAAAEGEEWSSRA